jgi:L-serine deaminase
MKTHLLGGDTQQAATSLTDVFLRQEMRLSGQPEAAPRAQMQSRIKVMRQNLERGLAAPQMSRSGMVRGGAARMQHSRRSWVIPRR